jgi:hypothetical protein
MTGIHTLASGTNLGPIIIPIGILVVVGGVVAVIVSSWFRLQATALTRSPWLPTASWPRKQSPTSRSFVTSWQS